MLKEMTEHGILWRCLDCQYTTKFKPVLFQHVESKHTISSGYNCEFCGKFCPSKMLLDATFLGNILASSSLFSMQLSAAVELKMVKHQTDHGVLWSCADCGYQTKLNPSCSNIVSQNTLSLLTTTANIVTNSAEML